MGNTSFPQIQVAAIIIYYSGRAALSRCLDSLWQQDQDGLFVIIINNSGASLEGLLQAYTDMAEIISPAGNSGYARGANIGILRGQELGAQYFCVLNSDVELLRCDMLRAFCQVSSLNMRPCLINPSFISGARQSPSDLPKTFVDPADHYKTSIFKTAFPPHNGGKNTKRENQQGALDILRVPLKIIDGAALFMNARVVKEVGLFDERYFLYFEDRDLGQRALQKSGELWCCPDFVVKHQAIYQKQNLPRHIIYYYYRNRLLFWHKHRRSSEYRLQTVFLILTALLALLRAKHPREYARLVYLAFTDFYARRFEVGREDLLPEADAS